MFVRGKASFKRINKKFPEITGEVYNALIRFHVLATGDRAMNESGAKSVAASFSKNIRTGQISGIGSYTSIYPQDKVIEALKTMKKRMPADFTTITKFFSGDKKALQFALGSIAIGTKGKRIEFDPKNWQKLLNTDFSVGSEDETEETEQELETPKSFIKADEWLDGVEGGKDFMNKLEDDEKEAFKQFISNLLDRKLIAEAKLKLKDFSDKAELDHNKLYYALTDLDADQQKIVKQIIVNNEDEVIKLLGQTMELEAPELSDDELGDLDADLEDVDFSDLSDEDFDLDIADDETEPLQEILVKKLIPIIKQQMRV